MRIEKYCEDLWNHVKVGSVETFQGQEKKAIIMTTVRSQRGKKGNLGFLKDRKVRLDL